MIFDASGNLYGTTAFGGMVGAGDVFELTPTAGGWTETTLYSFQAGTDGIYPNTSLVLDGAGNLYGTTVYGGTGDCLGTGCGIVFELTPPTNGGPWTETILYSFQGGADGSVPTGGLILDRSGSLYGTTGLSGDLALCSGAGCGTAFELSSVAGAWTLTTLHTFLGGTDGSYPSGLTMGSGGDLFGVTTFGGSAGLGTIYELYPSSGGWAEKILYAFPGNGGRGHNPVSPLVFSSQGYLVGTAQGGNANGCCGEVFALVPHAGGEWSEVVAFRFTNQDGGNAIAPPTPVFDSHGNLYGTGGGGKYKSGVAYQLKRANGVVKETYYSFCATTGCPDGAGPESGLILDSSGNLYGTTIMGGLGYGVVYEITR